MLTGRAHIPRIRVRGLLPKIMVARLRRARTPKAALICIYRDFYKTTTLQLVRAAEGAGWEIRLWAVDGPDPDMARYTVGQGPGSRPLLLNNLFAGVDPASWLVICDDDTQFVYPWSVATFLTVCARFGFDLAQPAHAWNSYLWSEFHVQRPGLIARDTNFVEAGPIVAVSPRIRPLVTPFPTTTEKGWGTDITWSDHLADGYRLGMVDGIAFEHLLQVATDYDRGPEDDWVDVVLAERGLTSVRDLMTTRAEYRWLPFRTLRSVGKPPLNRPASLPD
jgi:hypothetical protein